MLLHSGKGRTHSHHLHHLTPPSFNTHQCIQTSEIGVVETLGKYSRLQNAGINFFCCPFEYLAGKVSLRVQALDVRCETKTEGESGLITLRSDDHP